MARKRKHQLVLIVDFGSQYTQLIARRIRELDVYCRIEPCFSASIEKIREIAPDAAVFTGGPRSVYDDGAPHLDEAYFELGIPTLGICYGVQMATHVLGGRVEKATSREYGHTEMSVRKADPLFDGIASETVVWMSHGDRLEELAPGFETLAGTGDAPQAAVVSERHKFWGVQFHP